MHSRGLSTGGRTTAFACALLVALALMIQPAGATTASRVPYLQVSGFCATSRASLFTDTRSYPDTGYTYESESEVWGNSGCSTNTLTYPDWLQVQVILWDAPYPNAHYCVNDTFHPSFHTPQAAYIGDGYFIPGTCTAFYYLGHYWVADESYAWAYTYPGVWNGPGEAITDFNAIP